MNNKANYQAVPYKMVQNEGLKQWNGYTFPLRDSFQYFNPYSNKWEKVYLDKSVSKDLNLNRFRFADKLFEKAKSKGYTYQLRNRGQKNEYYVFYA
jgi:hypothetical protein